MNGETRSRATCPDHRLDIGEGVTGKADLIEEIARIYGYDNIPETRLADGCRRRRGNPDTGERGARARPAGCAGPAGGHQLPLDHARTREAAASPRMPSRMTSPTSGSPTHWRTRKAFLRHSVLASVLDTAERNSRIREHLAFFEIGPIFLAGEERRAAR